MEVKYSFHPISTVHSNPRTSLVILTSIPCFCLVYQVSLIESFVSFFSLLNSLGAVTKPTLLSVVYSQVSPFEMKALYILLESLLLEHIELSCSCSVTLVFTHVLLFYIKGIIQCSAVHVVG